MWGRIGKILAGYVGASWGVLQFFDWIVSHFFLSKSLVDLVLYLALLLLPTVLLLAWYGGRSDERRAHRRVVGIGVPLNLVVAAVVLFIVFHGRTLGATTDVVAVRDDNGALVNRRVPKTELRKKLIIFAFDAEPGDSDGPWLRYAAQQLLTLDLAQDPFVEVWDTSRLHDYLQKAHLTAGSAVPLAFARQLALAKHLDYFVLGTIKKQGGQYHVRAVLSSTESGHAVAEHEVAGADLFALADQLSVSLRRDLGIAAPHLASAPDLPVSELTTRSLPALQAFITGQIRFFDGDMTGIAQLEKAVALDPSFALADSWLVLAYYETRQSAKVQTAVAHTLANVYKLAEPTRFNFNAIRYLLEGNVDKQRAVLLNWVTLYPHSVEARQKLGEYYLQRDDRDQALATFEAALAEDPSVAEIVSRIMMVRQQRGELDQAVAVCRHYLAQFPGDAEMQVSLGNILSRQGNFSEAQHAYEGAFALDAENTNAAIGLRAVQFALGDYDGAQAQLVKLLAQTQLPEDRVLICDELMQNYALRGQTKRALEAFRERQRALASNDTPSELEGEALRHTWLFVRAGRGDEARATIAHAARDPLTMEKNINVRFSVEMAQLDLDNTLDDADAMARHLPALQTTIDAFGLETLRTPVAVYQARIKELRHDQAGARAAWQTVATLIPWDPRGPLGVARAQRLGGDSDGARVVLERALTRWPYSGEAHYELALALRDKDPAAARAANAKALAVYQSADADYPPAKNARALAEALAK